MVKRKKSKGSFSVRRFITYGAGALLISAGLLGIMFLVFAIIDYVLSPL